MRVIVRYGIYGVLMVTTPVLIGYICSYCLPIERVWVNPPYDSVMSQDEHLSMVGWRAKLQAEDWIDSYRMEWKFPAMAVLEVTPRVAVARLLGNQCVDESGEIFHHQQTLNSLPQLNMPEHLAPSGLALMNQINQQMLEHQMTAEMIQWHPSGFVVVDLSSKDQLVLPSIDHSVDIHLGRMLSYIHEHVSRDPIRCDFRASGTLSCTAINNH